MATQNGETSKQYVVHTVGGERLPITATEMNVDDKKKQITFLSPKEEWIFFLHGVTGIQIKHKGDVPRFGQLHM